MCLLMSHIAIATVMQSRKEVVGSTTNNHTQEEASPYPIPAISVETYSTYHRASLRTHSFETARCRKNQSIRYPYLTLSQDALSIHPCTLHKYRECRAA